MTTRNTESEINPTERTGELLDTKATYRFANSIMADAISKRGHVQWDNILPLAEHLVKCGYLTRSERIAHVEAFDCFGHVPAHDATVYTYRATKRGHECFCSGAILL